MKEYFLQLKILIKSMRSFKVLYINFAIFSLVFFFGVVENLLLNTFSFDPVAETIISWLDIILKRSFMSIVILGVIIQLETYAKIRFLELIKKTFFIAGLVSLLNIWGIIIIFHSDKISCWLLAFMYNNNMYPPLELSILKISFVIISSYLVLFLIPRFISFLSLLAVFIFTHRKTSLISKWNISTPKINVCRYLFILHMVILIFIFAIFTVFVSLITMAISIFEIDWIMRPEISNTIKETLFIVMHTYFATPITLAFFKLTQKRLLSTKTKDI